MSCTVYSDLKHFVMRDGCHGLLFLVQIHLIDSFVSCADNVHYQHTAQMVKALTEAEIKFRVQVR